MLIDSGRFETTGRINRYQMYTDFRDSIPPYETAVLREQSCRQINTRRAADNPTRAGDKGHGEKKKTL